ncbi:MAG: hypothetical protein HY721_02035 [Planctomycetes bacterium]|nr:hypothetical protein [Planctomycetota bacterium]
MPLLGPVAYFLSPSPLHQALGLLLTPAIAGTFVWGCLKVRYSLIFVAILAWFIAGFYATMSQIRC